MRATPHRILATSFLLLVILIVVCLLSFTVGPAELDLRAVLAEMLGKSRLVEMGRTILFRIRMPRVLLGGLVGAILAVGGVVFQALLRNPLAEPFILGVSGGAGFGAIIGILFGWALFPGVSAVAFVGGLFTIGLIMAMARGRFRIHTNTLLLSGVIVNAFFSAAIMFLISVTKDHRIHNVFHWLMGDFGLSTFKEILFLGPFLLVGFVLILAAARSLNLMAIGEETALYLGVQVEYVKKSLLILTSVMVSAAVCVSGIIGFVGLIIPHVLRLVLGSDHRLLLPASLLFGASFLIFCDMLARAVTSQGELPVGVITAICGGPFFIYLLRRHRG
ncbi:MAG: iron ABC transporter permease [Deltaproteobacteria bacterium]|nr:iron ABC transporter permease [Deltaproteobacteria bacterium]